MAYELHFVRMVDGTETPIPVDDWNAAAEGIEGVRLSELTEVTALNPTTGAVVASDVGGDAIEVYFADQHAWVPVFHFHNGRGSFNLRFEPGDTSHPVWRAAVALARRLDATLMGDEGEHYDLETGAAS